MAKVKTKQIPFDNKALEVAPYQWEWEVHGRRWRWTNRDGLNLFMLSPDGNAVPTAFFADIKQAATFAEGFHAGFQAATQTSAQRAPDLRLETTSDTTPAEPIGPGGNL